MPEVHNPSAQAVFAKTVTLSATQLKANQTAGVVVVPAPGAGRMLQAIAVGLVYKFGTVAYSPVNNGLTFNYDGDLPRVLFPPTFNPMIVGSANSAFVNAAAGLSGQVNILPGDDNKAIVMFGDDSNAGPIVTATLGAGGAGYAANDTGTITTGNGDATYRVLTVGGGGAVLTFSITSPGTGYTVGNGQATAPGGAQPGVGAGFTVNITAVQNGDGTLKVTTFYSIIPVP